MQVKGLYLMMGRGLERLSEVPAGCVLAIGGLDRCILKSATLSSAPACRPLAPMLFQARLVCLLSLVAIFMPHNNNATASCSCAQLMIEWHLSGI